MGGPADPLALESLLPAIDPIPAGEDPAIAGEVPAVEPSDKTDESALDRLFKADDSPSEESP